MFLLELGTKKAKIYGDSQLVIYQMTKEYKCISFMSQEYCKKTQELSKQLETISFIHIPREENGIADQLSQIASATE